MLGDLKNSAAENHAAELVWDLWSDCADWVLVEQSVEDWIREGQRCAQWLEMILVMQSDGQEIHAARQLTIEASELLGRVYSCIATLKTKLWSIQTGAATRFPQLLWPYSRLT